MADERDKLVEVTVKMPARLRDHLASICAQENLELDDLVNEQIKRWLLGQTIARIEGRKTRRASQPPAGLPKTDALRAAMRQGFRLSTPPKTEMEADQHRRGQARLRPLLTEM